MSHCILWCHFHCIWWINKWWQKMLMRFLDVAFVPGHSVTNNEPALWRAGLVLWVKLKANNKRSHHLNHINHRRQIWHPPSRQRLHRCRFGASAASRRISYGPNDSKYWSLIKETEWISDPGVELLNSSVLGYTSEFIKSQIPKEPQLAHSRACGCSHIHCNKTR